MVKEHIPVGVTTLLTQPNYDDIKLLIGQLHIHGINSILIGRISPVGRAKDLLEARDCDVEDFDQKVTSLLGISEANVSTQVSEKSKSYLPYTPFKCAAGSLYWSIYEKGEMQPCGASSYPGLSMGNISSFDDNIPLDRSTYLDKINNLPLVIAIKSGDIFCPFSNACHSP